MHFTSRIMQLTFAIIHLTNHLLTCGRRNDIEIAKAQGKYTGRKPILIDWTKLGQLYWEWKSKSVTGRGFMRRMCLSANAFYRRVREYKIRNGITEQTSA